ncbi:MULTISPECIES: nitroreductase family protein [unclassified Paracoccus (in: a-proteobacteria)]|uniref:nitroreductase family protein n=1 Tax=unclassified Paracoccus (in: a-proteobacteria) TaxID=2688777 RepID=UPI0015FFE8C5|nr:MULTISPECIES: nitroreductase family protein [unclassified Paracoccus (in: a-proteobacteria)]MBB1492443.1 nitroreductase family protein [Paracoccus sp. MC1854]MBB1498970.1 nitroreductase family protein [Paracoccus sp. MC1862]QQO45057.1 nitroreductase family protein [Paracoccus sp. MC1862]
MQHQNPQALEFLGRRRSHPPKTLTGPGPDRAQLMELLTIAARVPDHGKLEPWRFVVLERATLDRLAPTLAAYVRDKGGDDAVAEKAASAFASPVIVAVVSCPSDSPKVPQWEQEMSAGAVCLSLLNAALAAGWGAAWLSGPATDPDFARSYLGIGRNERIVGLVHIGSRTGDVPDRPRPDVAARTSFL